tara:strand:+ start:864 stop:1139 length:276 start_codon:yes stop_codon:yes gene_type:complete
MLTNTEQLCIAGCGACCIAPSISSPIPGMPNGKPAGVRCINLTKNNLCSLFGTSQRPDVCNNFKPDFEICSKGSKNALEQLIFLEKSTTLK